MHTVITFIGAVFVKIAIENRKVRSITAESVWGISSPLMRCIFFYLGEQGHYILLAAVRGSRMARIQNV